MRGDKEMRQLALRVSIALAAGMFSIVPVAYGAPVGGVVKHGDVTIKDYNTATKTLEIKDNVTATSGHNNVIDWQDFSVANGETVKFDGGDKLNNYMNIVSGRNTSEINGAISGGNEVYIVNPNGVIFGENASVDVGSLYASTRYINAADVAGKLTDGTISDMKSIFNDTTAGVATDIVNMGSISADKVVLEGQNIRLLNSADITAAGTNVTLKAGKNGYIHVGNAEGTDAGYDTAQLVKKVATDKTTDTFVADVDYFVTLTPTDAEKAAAIEAGSGSGGFWNRVKTTVNAAPAKNYMLASDIDASDSAGAITGTFSGIFDGNFHKISNIKSASGLFAKSSGTAKIYNVGVVDSTLKSTTGYAGAIVAVAAKGTVLDNVYNFGSTVSGKNYAHSGGLIGSASGVTLTNSYNTGIVKSGTNYGGGLIGTCETGTGTGVNTVTDCYSINSTGRLINAYAGTTGLVNAHRVYGEGVEAGHNIPVANLDNVLVKLNSGKYSAYTGGAHYEKAKGSLDEHSINTFQSATIVSWGDNISNTGGVKTETVTIDGVDYGKVTRPAWRIYEGQTAPMLTSQFKGIKTTNYNYDYFTASGTRDADSLKYNSGTNGGKNMPAYTTTDSTTKLPDGLVYNGEYLKIVNRDKKTAAAVDKNNALKDAAVAFSTIGDTTIDNTHVLYNAEGRKGATYKRATSTQYDLALLYSDQDGYDLYGNNISIAPRTIKVDTESIKDSYVVKEYDGTSDVDSDDLKSLFSGDSSSTTGILDVDKEDVTLDFTGDTQFQDNAHPDYDADYGDSSVGLGKWVPFDGNITLDYTGDDYVLEGGGSSIAYSGKFNGVITPKAIPVKLASSTVYSKTYDGDSIVKNADGTEYKVTDSDFSAIASYLVDDDAVTLGYDNRANYVKKATAAADTDSFAGDYTGKVRFGGLVLNSTDDTKNNYILVDGTDKTNILYSSGKILYKDTDGKWKEGDSKTTGGALFGDGEITRRVITSNGFSWYNGDVTEANKKDAVREYNGGSAFTRDADGIAIAGKTVSNEYAVEGTDYATGATVVKMLDDGVKFIVQGAEFITSLSDASADTAENVDGTGVVGGAKGVRYTIKVEGTAASNYSLDTLSNELSDGKDGLIVIGKGEITPRTINLMLNSDADKSKTYDGDADVKRGSGTSAAKEFYFYADPDKASENTDFVIYADDDADHHFLSTDTTAKIKLTGAYQAMPAIATADVTAPAVAGKDVYYDTKNNEVLAKDIAFTAKVMDGDNVSLNYKIATGTSSGGGTVITEGTDTEGETVFSLTGTDAKGKINQREITSLTFDNVSKTYDGSDKVTNSKSADTATFKTDDEIVIKGAVLSDGLTFTDTGDTVETVFKPVGTGDSALIMGQYGKVTDDVWESNPNAGATNDKDVKYTIKDELLLNNNYKMDISEVIAKNSGTINQLEIKESEVKLKRKTDAAGDNIEITKVYDTNKNVAHDAVTAESYLDRIYVDKDTSAGSLDIGFTIDKAEYDDKHSNDSALQGVTYTLKLTDTTNIKVKKDDGTALADGLVNKTTDYTGAAIQGTITPLGIKVTQDDIVSSVTKTYDGGLTVKAIDEDTGTEAKITGEDVVSGINEQILEADRTAGIINATDAEYENKNVNAIDSDLDAETGLKKVTYNLKLAGDTYNDYKFVDAGGHDIGEGDTKNKLYKANGTITPRAITVSTTALDAASGWPVKTYGTYDTSATYDDDLDKLASVKTMPDSTKFNFGADDALVRSEFDFTKLKGRYGELEDGEFTKNGDANIAGKDVQYSGVIDALGDNAGNYTVEDTFYGKGKISPLELTRDRISIAIGAATKTYDNTYDVKKGGDLTTRTNNYITKFQVETTSGVWEDFGYSYDYAQYQDDKTITATDVMYKLGLGDIDKNYVIAADLYTEDLVNGYINKDAKQWWQKTTDNEITKATVYASLQDEPGTDTVVKPYDTYDTVTTPDVAKKVQVRGLDFGDGTTFTPGNIHYEDADVGRDAEGNVAAKNVYYDVALTPGDLGDFTNNYVLVADTGAVYDKGTDTNGTLTGQGMITPLSITANFAPAEKPYDPNPDTTTAVRNADKVITFSGADGADAIALDDAAKALINGTYGTHDSTKDAFTADGHVYRPNPDTDEVGTKTVRYENIADAYHDYIKRNPTNVARNYEVADEPVFYGNDHGDKITPLSLDTVKAVWSTVDKTYDTTPDVRNPEGVLTLEAASSTAAGVKKNLDYAYETAQYVDTAGAPVSVVGTYALNYDVNKVKTNQGDYQLSAEAAAAATRNWLSTDAANNVDGTEATGKINRRVLTVNDADAYFRKIYNGDELIDSAAAKEQIKFAFSEDDAKAWAIDFGNDNVDYSVVANFVGADANVMPGETLNGKNVKYTLNLMGAAKNNYTLTADTVAADVSPVLTTGEVTLENSGDIQKRELKIKVVDGSVTERDYDGTPIVYGFDSSGRFDWEDPDTNTGVVGSEDVNFDKSEIKAAYAHDGDVNRGNYTGKGKVENAIVNFTNFKLDDSPANSNYYISTKTLTGSGLIKPLAIHVDVQDAPIKEYDGTTTVGADNWNMYADYSNVIADDAGTVKAFIKSADFKTPEANGDKAYTYNLAMENGNNYQLVLADDSKHNSASTDDGMTMAISGKDGTITPRVLTASIIKSMTKEYDGTTDGTENAVANVSLDNRVVTGDNVGLTAKAVYDNPNAGKSEGSAELQNHKVTYTLNLSNPNYKLAADTITGTGTISRKGLNIVATPVSINSGEAMPVFSGTVDGLVARDRGLASGFTFDTLPTVTNSSVGDNPVYGWYRNQISGNFGLNYTFDQAAENAVAFTVQQSNMLRDNPDTRITPHGNVYQQISSDMSSGFGDNGAAAIEYMDKSGNVIARENIDSGEIHGAGREGQINISGPDYDSTKLATIGIAGGEIVNMDGADAAGTANIAVDGDGSVVNLEVLSLNSANSSAAIQIVDENGKVLEENEDKAEKQKKDGEIAIESSDEQSDEIELKVENEGVNVA